MQPNTPRSLTPQIVEFDDAFSGRDIDTIVRDERVEVVQTSRPVEQKTWERVAQIFDRRPDIRLRLYGFYGLTCDLSVVRYVPNVRRFSADCLHAVTGVEHLARLENLERLDIGIYDLTSFDFLDDVEPRRMTHLSLLATRSKKPNIERISRFRQIETLYLEGQSKGIEAIARLENLRDVTLRSITVSSLDFLRDLRHLASLDIKLGGTNDLTEIANLEALRYLELWQIGGLEDLSTISEAVALELLFLQSLTRVTELPNLSKLARLRAIHLENMNGLKNLEPLRSAPALEAFGHVGARGFEPEDYAELFAKKTLKSFHGGTGSRRKNRQIAELAEAAGIGGAGTNWQAMKRDVLGSN